MPQLLLLEPVTVQRTYVRPLSYLLHDAWQLCQRLGAYAPGPCGCVECTC